MQLFRSRLPQTLPPVLPESAHYSCTFELRDTLTQKRLWQFKTGDDDEPGGIALRVGPGRGHQDGVYETIWLIRKSGEQIKLGQVFDYLPKAEVTAYCDDTTAGTFWSQFSWREFIKLDGREYFFIRTYWGRYILVDLANGRINNKKKISATIESSILKRSRGAIELENKKLWADCKSCGGKHPDSQAARSLLVLELHQIRGREYLISEFGKLEDHSMHDVNEHVERLRRGRRKR
ncbi:MAG: hypothetical protein H7A51_09455 [Akkermansiaceae bacterium]|nr:hypothetical protein [Akkermansiaceae bacterium]